MTVYRVSWNNKTAVRWVLCSGSAVVSAYDSETGRPGSNPEWGLIYYEAPINAQGLPEPSSLRGSTLGTRAGLQLSIKAVTGHAS